MPLDHREKNKHEAKEHSVYSVQSYRCIILSFEPQFNTSSYILTSCSVHQTRISFLMVYCMKSAWQKFLHCFAFVETFIFVLFLWEVALNPCYLCSWHIVSWWQLLRTMPWQAKLVCSFTKSYLEVLPKAQYDFKEQELLTELQTSVKDEWLLSKAAIMVYTIKTPMSKTHFLGKRSLPSEWSLKFIHGEQTKQAMIQNHLPSYLKLN